VPAINLNTIYCLLAYRYNYKIDKERKEDRYKDEEKVGEDRIISYHICEGLYAQAAPILCTENLRNCGTEWLIYDKS
jgi:hypothetical protein